MKLLDDANLVITYRKPHCQKPAGYTVGFATDNVTLTVFSESSGAPECRGGLGQASETVRLDHPLAGRTIVDGACVVGQLLADSTSCETGFTTE